MTTLEACQALLEAIEDLVTASDYGVDTFQITAGEPAAPSGEDCIQVSVWASSYFNAVSSMFHEDNPCLVVRGVQLNYRIDYCYSETEAGRTPAQHLISATGLYGLADAIWCGLPGVDIFERRCQDLQFDALSIDAPSGGVVSASSGVRLQIDCEPVIIEEEI